MFGTINFLDSDNNEAKAAQWLIEPSVTATTQYSENQRLTVDRKTETMQITLSPVAKLSYQTARSEFISSARLRSARYSSEQAFDSDDWYGAMVLRRKLQLSQIELAANYAYSSTQVSEVDDTGLVQDNKRRSRLKINPSWQHQLNFSNRIHLSYSFDNISYLNGEPSGLFDYQSQTVSTSLIHQFDVRHSINIGVYASHFDSPGRGSTFLNIGLQGALEQNLTETMKLKLGAGVRQTKSKLTFDFLNAPVNVRDSVVGLTFNGSLMHRWQHARIEGSLKRSIDPSGSGYVILRDQSSINLTQELSEKWQVTFSLQRMKNKSLRNDVTGVNRNYISVESRLSWRWQQNITLQGVYRYREQKYDTQSGTARDNSIKAMLDYHWPK